MAVLVAHTLEEQEARAEAGGWGWQSDMRTEREVLDLLFALVRITKPNVCVETGTYFGHGTQAISDALHLNERGHLWTVEFVDEYTHHPTDRVTFVHADSREWSATEAPPKIDFAFVDCCEEPQGRVEVFKNLLPRMNPGALLCAHDVNLYRGEEYLEPMCEAIGRGPNLAFPAVDGIGIWVV